MKAGGSASNPASSGAFNPSGTEKSQFRPASPRARSHDSERDRTESTPSKITYRIYLLTAPVTGCSAVVRGHRSSLRPHGPCVRSLLHPEYVIINDSGRDSLSGVFVHLVSRSASAVSLA